MSNNASPTHMLQMLHAIPSSILPAHENARSVAFPAAAPGARLRDRACCIVYVLSIAVLGGCGEGAAVLALRILLF